MTIAIILLTAMCLYQIYRNFKAQRRFDRIREAVNKACDNADPKLDHTTLDELLKDIWNAMYN